MSVNRITFFCTEGMQLSSMVCGVVLSSVDECRLQGFLTFVVGVNARALVAL